MNAHEREGFRTAILLHNFTGHTANRPADVSLVHHVNAVLLGHTLSVRGVSAALSSAFNAPRSTTPLHIQQALSSSRCIPHDCRH